jgi:hypothetical protein
MNERKKESRVRSCLPKRHCSVQLLCPCDLHLKNLRSHVLPGDWHRNFSAIGLAYQKHYAFD